MLFTLGRLSHDQVDRMEQVERTRAAIRHTASHPRARSGGLLIVVLLLSTSLSGCLSIDFFLPQKDDDPTGPTGNGAVRLWVAVQPGAIGTEFVHYNLTFGPVGHMQDLFGERVVPMESTLATADVVRLERQRQAALLGSISVPEGRYFGFTFQVTNATLATSTVIGNDDGKEVVRIDPHDIPEIDKRGSLLIDHNVFAGSVTDLYLEIDMRASLLEEKGQYSHATKVTGVSVYIDGLKLSEERFGDTPSDGRRGIDPYGSRWSDVSKYPSPAARYEVEDPRTGKEIYDSLKVSKRYNKAIGLGQDLDFSSRSHSRVLENGARTKITEWDWNFGDGTGATGPVVSKNWTSGGVYDVSLTVRDEFSLVGRTFGSFIVPYRPDEAVTTQRDARAGVIHLGSGTADVSEQLSTATERLTFPEDLEDGDLYIGGYRVTLRFGDVTGGAGGPATIMQMHAKSGYLDAEIEGTSPLLMETAGLPFWRGSLKPWVDETLEVDLELVSGAEVTYELVVEALYFENATRGLDSHAAHRHGTWSAMGPDYRNVHWNGTARPPPEEE